MAKRKPTKKTTKKKPATKKAPARKKTTAKKPAAKKKPVTKKKAATKKAPARKPSKKVTKKPASKKKTTKKAPTKKAPSKKPTSKKAASKKKPSTSKKPATKKTTKKKSPSKSAAASAPKKPATNKATASADAAKLKAARAAASKLAALAGLPAVTSNDFAEPEAQTKKRRLTKSPISPTNLKKFQDVLIQKHREVAGDVSAIEDEALNPSRSSDLSSLPQHMADQGSDEFDQALSLGIAASQRRLLVEIDAALDRIDNGVYGICELTGSAIHKDRLEATPWCRYSLDGARMADRGITGITGITP